MEHNAVMRKKYKMQHCGYIPCIDCIIKRRANKIVHCTDHDNYCCFIPKGRDWRKGPPEKITLTKDLVEATKTFKMKYAL